MVDGSQRRPERLRIAMLCFSLGPRFGGAERQAVKLSSALVAAGHEVTLFAAGFERGAPQHERLPGYPAELPPLTVERLGGLAGTPAALRLRWRSFLVALTLTLWRRRRDFDLFHCHGTFDVSSLPLSLLAPWLSAPALLKHASGVEYEVLRRRTRCPRWLARRLHRRCLGQVSNSEEVAHALHTDLMFKRCVTRYLPNGVLIPREPAQLRGERGLELVCVANFHPAKNQAALIRAWATIDVRRPGDRLTFAGSGQRLEACRRLADELQLGDAVRFLGFCDDIPALLDGADGFLFPSRHREGMPNVILEAMAAGLPIIALDQPALRTLIEDGREGLLLAGDEPTYWEAALRALQSPARRREFGLAARERAVRDFSIESVAERYVSLYRDLISLDARRTTAPRGSTKSK